MVENIFLISPMLYTYINVQERHQFLEDTIGPVKEESEAMARFQFLIVFAPIVIVLCFPLQVLFIWLYNKYGHPWKKFFREISKSSSKNKQENISYELSHKDQQSPFISESNQNSNPN